MSSSRLGNGSVEKGFRSVRDLVDSDVSATNLAGLSSHSIDIRVATNRDQHDNSHWKGHNSQV
jgi:hypothetical protein